MALGQYTLESGYKALFDEDPALLESEVKCADAAAAESWDDFYDPEGDNCEPAMKYWATAEIQGMGCVGTGGLSPAGKLAASLIAIGLVASTY